MLVIRRPDTSKNASSNFEARLKQTETKGEQYQD